jgi:hypothetical protein
MLLLVLLVFIPPFFSPRHAWAWVLSAMSLAATTILFLRENRKYTATNDALICRSFLRHEQIAWRDVEAVGTQLLRSKYGPIGTTFKIYGISCMLRPLFSPDQTGEFSRLLRQHCSHAVWIDEDDGTFSAPPAGDIARIREIVARHARRLRRYHSVAAVSALSLLVPVVAFVYFDNFALPRDLLVILFCMLFVAAFSWSHWAALWHLRR